MKNKIIFSLLFLFTLAIALSCQKDDKWKDFQKFDESYPLNGQYSVTWSLNGAVQGDPTILSVYNTADHQGIWIDDNLHFWQFKVKANVSGNNFSVTKGVDEIWDDSTTITNGSIVDGNFSMNVEWVSSAGDVYVCKGKLQTGFEE